VVGNHSLPVKTEKKLIFPGNSADKKKKDREERLWQ